MATQSENKSQARRRKDRRLLHEAVDRILDGPDDSDVDKWAVQVLVDIGSFVRAAAPALDYEVGRVISGVDRPLGYFPSNLSWEGARLATDRQMADAWVVAGSAARGDRPPAETQQRALAALLRPIASISCHSWLDDLADALDALSFGEVLPVLTPSARGLTGVGKGRTAWQLRLLALQWTEFQVAAHKTKTKAEAYESVARAFGRSVETIKEWRGGVAKELGGAVVREALELSRREGELAHVISRQVASDKADEKDRRYLMHLERAYCDKALKTLAATFKALPRKKDGVGK